MKKGEKNMRATIILLCLLLAGSACAIQFETTINVSGGYVDITLVDTIQFVMSAGGAAYVDLAIRAGLPGGQYYSTYPEGFSYSHNGAPAVVTTGVHMPFAESFGFVVVGDVLFVDQGNWTVFSIGDTMTYEAGTVRLPWSPAVTYLPTGDYEVFLVDDQLGTLYSRFPTVANEDLTWGSIKSLYR